MYEIRLDSPLNQNDIIRIDHEGEDVSLSVVRLYDSEGRLINKSDDVCRIKIKERLSTGDVVYKTKDYLFYKELEAELDKEYRRFALNMKVYAYPGAHLIIDAESQGIQYLYESDEILEEAEKNPTGEEQVIKQLGRLGDTIFTLGSVEFEECGAFIPVKLLNGARRRIVQELYQLKLEKKQRRIKTPSAKQKIAFPQKKPYLTASVTTRRQYDICRACGIEEVYFDNVVRRNQNTYEKKDGQLLIGGYGGICYYRNTNPFVTDYSLNVVNAESCRTLHLLGAKRVTLSYEMNKKDIRALLDAYLAENGGYPSLEMIVYGRAPLMFTKYCPLKKMNQCGSCRTKSYELQDEYGAFPVLSHEDCTTTILNGKILNLLDEMPSIEGIEAFRLNFTVESAQEVESIVRSALRKLEGTCDESLFNRQTDTRGHFNKEIL